MMHTLHFLSSKLETALWHVTSDLLLNRYMQLATAIFFIGNSIYFVILILGFLNARRKFCQKSTGILERLTPLRSLRPVSLLVPCHNEEVTVVDALHAMLKLDYPNYDVIVCNDGSTDNTMSKIIDNFDLIPIQSHLPQILPFQPVKQVYRSKHYANLLVLDKYNGGKADALNAAICFSRSPLICCVDSDSMIDSKGLMAVTLPFLESDEMIAAGGTILLLNPDQASNEPLGDPSVSSSWIGRIQAMEYLRAFLVGRMGWDYLNANPIISGAFGLFHRELVIKVGGYSKNTIGEDMELVLRMQSYCLQEKRPFKIRLLPDPVCWTEPPSDIRTLGHQRIRWTQGLAESLWRHKGMLFRPSTGLLGMIALPYFAIFELLSAPVELIGYVVVGAKLWRGETAVAVLLPFFAVTLLYGMALNIGAIAVDQMTFKKYHRASDVFKIMTATVLEPLGFHQLHLYWRLTGIIRWLRGKQSWGHMKRRPMTR